MVLPLLCLLISSPGGHCYLGVSTYLMLLSLTSYLWFLFLYHTVATSIFQAEFPNLALLACLPSFWRSFIPCHLLRELSPCPRSAVLLCVSVCSKPSALPASLSSKLCSWTHANLLFLSPCSLCKLPQRAPHFPCQGSVQAGASRSCPCGAEITFVSIAGFPMFILFLLLIICIWVGVGCAYRYRWPWRPEALNPLVLELQAL